MKHLAMQKLHLTQRPTYIEHKTQLEYKIICTATMVNK